jgi:hypothetical protein
MPGTPSTDNVLILGLAKTGSTGLYTSVKEALARAGHDHYCLFEPTRADQLHSIHRYAPQLPVLTKVMIAREPQLELRYDLFSRRITMLRDPRDMIVSFLLFRPFIRADVAWERVEPFAEAVRAKERDPASTSVRALHELADDLGLASYRLDRVVEFMAWQEALIDRHDVFTVRYADYVAGRLDPLSSYLGVRVERSTPSSPWLDHIMRSGTTGDWRHWFTPEDVAAYRPYLTRYMQRFGYDDDWTLATEPVIAPETSSGYIEGKYRRRREQQQRRRRGLPHDADPTTQRAHVEHLAADGHSQAMYRIAKAAVAAGGPGDVDRAFRFAYRAAVQGHKPAMRLLADLYRRGAGVEADEGAAAFWAAEGAGHQPPPTRRRRLLSRR